MIALLVPLLVGWVGEWGWMETSRRARRPRLLCCNPPGSASIVLRDAMLLAASI